MTPVSGGFGSVSPRDTSWIQCEAPLASAVGKVWNGGGWKAVSMRPSGSSPNGPGDFAVGTLGNPATWDMAVVVPIKECCRGILVMASN